MFKIISTGRETGDWFEFTLDSIAEQKNKNYQVHVIDDWSGLDSQERIIKYIDIINGQRPSKQWIFTENYHSKYATRNQYEGVRYMQPEDDDIIVFLDLDGDQLAHPGVLDKLQGYYDDGALMTYGGYKPVPDEGVSPPAAPYPPEVVENNTYRKYPCMFNHLRTVKWDVLKRIPEEYYKWPDGRWLTKGTDYTVMLGCLELAGDRCKVVDETVMYYNNRQPHPDYLRDDDKSIPYILTLPPLKRMV